MKDKGELIKAVAMEALFSAIVCTLYNLATPFGGLEHSFFPFSLFLFSFGFVVSNHILYESGRKTKTIIVLNFALIAIVFSAIFFIERNRSVLWRFLTLPFLIFSAFYSIHLTVKEISYRGVLRALDAMVCVSLFSVAYTSFYGYSLSLSYAALFGTAVVLLAVVISRQAESRAKGGWFSVMLSVFLIILLVFCFAGYSEKAGEGLVGIWAYFMHLIERFALFVEWLIGLLPHIFPTPSENLIPMVDDDPFQQKALITEPLDVTLLVGIVVIFFIVVGSILAYQLLAHRSRNEKRRTERSTTRRRISFFTGVKRTLLRLRTRIYERRYIRKNKNNTIGLYFYIERKLKQTDIRKRRNETARIFLRRISFDLKIDLCWAIEDIERFFYSKSGDKPMPVENATALRRSLVKALSRRRLDRAWLEMKTLAQRFFPKHKTTSS